MTSSTDPAPLPPAGPGAPTAPIALAGDPAAATGRLTAAGTAALEVSPEVAPPQPEVDSAARPRLPPATARSMNARRDVVVSVEEECNSTRSATERTLPC